MSPREGGQERQSERAAQALGARRHGCGFRGAVAGTGLARELPFADVDVAHRAPESNRIVSHGSRFDGLQVDCATHVELVHRRAAADCNQSERNEQSGDRQPFISEIELIHDEFSCVGTEAFVHRRYHATMPHAAISTICHASHQER